MIQRLLRPPGAEYGRQTYRPAPKAKRAATELGQSHPGKEGGMYVTEGRRGGGEDEDKTPPKKG